MEKEIEFLQFLVENMVNDKDSISIERKEDEMGILLSLKVAKDDMKVIIGKAGSNVEAMRTMLRVVWSKEKKRINLKVID